MTLTKRTLFYLVYLPFVLTLWISICYIPKGHEVLYINNHQTTVYTQFFKIASFLGEGITIALLTLYLIVKNRDMVKYWALAFFVQLGLTQGLKNLLNAPRPLSYFPKGTLIPIENVPELLHKSMPSGHTASAFLMTTFIIIFLIKETKQTVFLLTISAIMVGVSRIYLLAHFKEDVLVGSIIGVLSTEISFYYYKSKSIDGSKWKKDQYKSIT